MLVAIDYSQKVVMFEKVAAGYVPHVFSSQSDFKIYMGTHQHGFFTPRSAVYGKVYKAIDHTREYFSDPENDFTDDVYCPACASQERRETDRTTSKYSTCVSYFCCDCGHTYQELFYNRS